MWRYLIALGALTAANGCGQPDCRAVCEHTLPCHVTFAPADDPQLRLVESGERTAQVSCEKGCRESLAVDESSAQCLLAIEVADADRCRAQMLGCLGTTQDAN